ncbi:hypothetical protein AYM02_07255 [Coxiella burnetii]|nr:hypothetical protein AUR58_08000 [Coxiella burnetii]AML55056.1 hypothetical protein AYM38_07155 [Coxiella burnetii]ATN69035.1 hypothetical protein AYM00_07560 [Coxiella burnetii]ATN70952.1 hypothetical protein AYM02_07255 [Coxiella burnetii]ATN72866.1 hypothetical protein AYM11_07035 [Coxiella burnetii]
MTKEDQIYAWGNSSALSCFGFPADAHIYTPRPVRLPQHLLSPLLLVTDRIIQLTAGHNHILALTRNGCVFAWGNNWFGQLGLGNREAIAQPTLLLFPDLSSSDRIIQLAAGGYHSFARTEKNRVFGWGGNYTHQLGLVNGVDRTQPTELYFPGLSNADDCIIEIGASSDSSFALTKQGVFVWGDNALGQLGLNYKNHKISIERPTYRPLDKRIPPLKFMRSLHIKAQEKTAQITILGSQGKFDEDAQKYVDYCKIEISGIHNLEYLLYNVLVER